MFLRGNFYVEVVYMSYQVPRKGDVVYFGTGKKEDSGEVVAEGREHLAVINASGVHSVPVGECRFPNPVAPHDPFDLPDGRDPDVQPEIARAAAKAPAKK